MSPAAEHGERDGAATGKGGDGDGGGGDGTDILAKQLFSVHNGRLDKFGTGFDSYGPDTEEQIQYVDLVKRSFRHITGWTWFKVKMALMRVARYDSDFGVTFGKCEYGVKTPSPQ